MKKWIVKIVLFIVIIVFIVLLLHFLRKIKHNNGIATKYDINKKLEYYSIDNDEKYREYLRDISVIIKPFQLNRFIDFDSFYFDRKYDNEKTGEELIFPLIKDAYKNLLCHIAQKNQIWNDLPLTNNFNSKFNENDGCIKEFDFTGKSISKYSFNDKKFSIESSWIADDAYEKYTDNEINFMLEYGAGAYNLDWYNYEFVLDDNGYLDDIIFLDITPVIVEGYDLEHPENNIWNDGDE